MNAEISFKQFARSDLKNDPELLREFVTINRQKEMESGHPLPISDFVIYQNFYLLTSFPFDEQSYVLVEYESRCIAYGTVKSNLKLDSEIAFIFMYIVPEYRGNKLLWPIAERLLASIPPRIKKLTMEFRSDSLAPNSDYRITLLTYLQSKLGPVTYKSRRSTAELEKCRKNEIVSKAESLKKQALDRGFSFIKNIDRPDFATLPFSLSEYISFLESIYNDYPREDASREDITLHNDIFLYRYDVLEPLKRTRWNYIAVHTKSKKPAGVTEVFIDKTSPVVVYQADTGVAHNYRGNKLGLTLKYLMLAEILTNELTEKSKYWMTVNAYSNKHMIDINDELGYKEDGIWYQFEIEKEKFNLLVKEKIAEKEELLKPIK